MAVISSPKIVELAQAKDPKAALIAATVGSSEVEVLGNNLLVATYIRPEKTRGGIIRPDTVIKEDEFQGNVGLVVRTSEGDEEALHKWVVFGYNDGLRLRFNDVPCRIISIDRIRAIVPDPSKVL